MFQREGIFTPPKLKLTLIINNKILSTGSEPTKTVEALQSGCGQKKSLKTQEVSPKRQ